MSKRFLLLVGPHGYLTTRPAGCPMLSDRYKDWDVLMKINRPLTIPRMVHAKAWAIRRLF